MAVSISYYIKLSPYVLMSLLYLLPLSIPASSIVEKIEWIRSEYKKIRTNLKTFHKYEYSFSGESAEGADAIGYIADFDRIKLIEVTYFGEMGKSYFEFYYSNKNTFFILEKKFTYNTHISMTQDLVEEWNKEDEAEYEAFDPNKTKVEEWRYYFTRNEILKTIGPNKDLVTDPSNAKLALASSISNYKMIEVQLHSNR